MFLSCNIIGRMNFKVAIVDDELYIVINRGELIAGNLDYTVNELKDARQKLANFTLKVILETGELNKVQIKVASEIAIDAGADFIKTSSVKGKKGTTI